MRFYSHLPSRGVPPSLGAALNPVMNRSVWSWSSRGRVFGQPGTMAIPVPDPAGMPDESLCAMASIGVFWTFSAPNVIFPPIYYENDPPLLKEHAPVSRVSDDQMPVPAGRAPGRINANQYKQRLGGQRQVRQPQVVQRWRGMYGGE